MMTPPVIWVKENRVRNFDASTNSSCENEGKEAISRSAL
jgi:hypothetical protein